MSTQTALSVIERASVALGSSALEIHLKDLVKKNADIVAIANKDGREQVHIAAMVLRKQRTTIAAAGKGARDDAAKFCKAVIDEEKRLIGLIEPEEDRLIKLRDDWDAEREAAIAKEAMRRKHIEEMADDSRGLTKTVLRMASIISSMCLRRMASLAIAACFSASRSASQILEAMEGRVIDFSASRYAPHRPDRAGGRPAYQAA